MISLSSMASYSDIEKALPLRCKAVYRTIYNNPGVAIGEIGKMLEMQNSSVSGRVNNLIQDGLVHYAVDEEGKPIHKVSSVSGKSVMMLKVNDLFNVKPEQVKQKSYSQSARNDKQMEFERRND